jgi:uncharacterized protein (TIGR02270 family)
MSEGITTIDILAEDLVVLWSLRDRLVRAPHLRLANLVAADERVEAHIDAIRVAYRSPGSRAALEAKDGELRNSFFSFTIAMARTCIQQTCAQFDVPASWNEETIADPSSVRPIIAALAWAGRDTAAPVLERLLAHTNPRMQAIGIASVGARRMDPGELLARFGNEPQPLPRARAYRTIGQLGRHDLMALLRPGLTDADPECRFWSAWAAARMGAGEEALGVLAEIAWTNQPRAMRALDLLLRRLDVPHANAWLREFAKLPDRQRDLIRAIGVVGDPVYIPWLIERMVEPGTARLAGEALSMITGLDLAYRDLDRKPPRDFESGPNDDPADENVALDEDENLPWPDPGRVGSWWLANLNHYNNGTAYFLGTPKPAADWLAALSDAFQRQRHAAALELAIRMPQAAMFEVRARGRLQRRLIARSGGLA